MRLLAIAVLSLAAGAQDPKSLIRQALADNFAAIKSAQTKTDLQKAIDALDTPDWSSTLPNGQTWTHADALRELEAILKIPPAQRPTPDLDFIDWHETRSSVQVVYWVSNTANGRTVGSIARDTWIKTPAGWRRSRHEKFFDSRTLIDNGKPVIVPPLPDRIRS